MKMWSLEMGLRWETKIWTYAVLQEYALSQGLGSFLRKAQVARMYVTDARFHRLVAYSMSIVSPGLREGKGNSCLAYIVHNGFGRSSAPIKGWSTHFGVDGLKGQKKKKREKPGVNIRKRTEIVLPCVRGRTLCALIHLKRRHREFKWLTLSW